MAISQTQRIVDLAYAGHAVSEIANLLGVAENTVRTALQTLTNLPSSQGGTPVVNVLTPVSGTALQDQTNLPSNIYAAITLHAGGTVTIAIGPTNAVATTIVTADDASLASTQRFKLPAGWWFKITVAGSAAIGTVTQVTG